LIILLSVLSVVSAFFIYNAQLEVKKNSDQANTMYLMVDAVEKDIEEILASDKEKQQLGLMTLQELEYLNELMNQSKEYNKTHPSTFMDKDVYDIAQQFVSKVKILNNLIRETNAYNWSIINGGNNTNNYSYYYMDFYLIRNNYFSMKNRLDPDIEFWLNATFFPNQIEILDLNLYNWEGELYYFLEIVVELGQYTKLYATNFNVNISKRSMFDFYALLSDAYNYKLNSDVYDQAVNIMTTALVLMTIGAVIIAYVVSIEHLKYIYTSLLIGLIVSLMGVILFVMSYQYLIAANLILYFQWW